MTATIAQQMLAYYLHSLDPIIFRIYDNVGPRWYGLAYVLAFVSSYFLFVWLSKRGYADLPPQCVGDAIPEGTARSSSGSRTRSLSFRANRSVVDHARSDHRCGAQPTGGG